MHVSVQPTNQMSCLHIKAGLTHVQSTARTFTAHINIITGLYLNLMLTDPPLPQLLQYVRRDTSLLLMLNSSLAMSGVVSSQVNLVSAANGLDMTVLLNLTISNLDGGHYLFVESLDPKQEYSLKLAAVNEVGVSAYTEWINFTTTSAGNYN